MKAVASRLILESPIKETSVRDKNRHAIPGLNGAGMNRELVKTVYTFTSHDSSTGTILLLVHGIFLSFVSILIGEDSMGRRVHR